MSIVTALPTTLGSMLEIEQAIQTIAQDCINLDTDRKAFEQALMTQLCIRLPLGWGVFGGFRLRFKGTESNPGCYLMTNVCRHEYRMNDPARLRMSVRLPDHPRVGVWDRECPWYPYAESSRDHVIPSHLYSDRQY